MRVAVLLWGTVKVKRRRRGDKRHRQMMAYRKVAGIKGVTPLRPLEVMGLPLPFYMIFPPHFPPPYRGQLLLTKPLKRDVEVSNKQSTFDENYNQ